MPRQTGRHRLIEDDGISDDSDNSSADNDFSLLHGDEAEEFALNDPYSSKKRKRKTKERTKDEALYGDFLPEAREGDFRPPKRANHLKTTTFVPSVKTQTDGNYDDAEKLDNLAFDEPSTTTKEEEKVTKEESESSEEDMDESSSEEEIKVPRVREEIDEEPPSRPSFGGIGSTSNNHAPNRPALGGIGSARRPETPQAEPKRTQKSFLSQNSSNSPASTPKPAVQMTAQEKRHFASLESAGGIGFKLLAKMGWSAGTGLGTTGDGRINPVESQQRPQGMGIGHGGFKELSKASKLEKKRREGKAEAESDSENDDDLTPAARKRKQQHRARQKALAENKGQAPDRTEAWKKATPQRRKARVEHRTYEELVGGTTEGDVDPGLGQIIDLTGSELPSLASTLSLAIPVSSSDTTRLPELRHNLKLISDTKQADLNTHIKEGKAVLEKRKWTEGQQIKAQKAVMMEAEHIKRMRDILAITEEVMQLSKRATAQRSPPSDAFESMGTCFGKLLEEYAMDYVPLQLDQVVVAAVAPVLRMSWNSWSPLEEPDLCVADLKRWRKALSPVPNNPETAQNGVKRISLEDSDSYSNGAFLPTTMSAFDALIWTYWLPRVRSAINNSWNATDAAPAVTLFSTWDKLLPAFVRDNVLDQLILPKVSKAMSDWSPRTSDVPLHVIVFPWLPYAGTRMDGILEEAKRRLSAWLKSWRPRDKVPTGFAMWRQVYSSRDWDDLMLKYILPSLGGLLRDKFEINPRDQQLQPLEQVIIWRPHLRSAMVDQLLVAEFFPKWLEALYIWLTASPDYAQVSQWYTWWKGWFKEDVANLPGVKAGFAKGLDLMNQALVLGEDAPYRLQRPSLEIEQPQANAPTPKPKRIEPTQAEVTFRSIVEEMAAENNLIFMATGRSHEVSGQALFRVSTNINGKNGITVYLHDDIVWAQEGSAWVPIGVQEMISRAQQT